jgi:hypothetical protein
MICWFTSLLGIFVLPLRLYDIITSPGGPVFRAGGQPATEIRLTIAGAVRTDSARLE